MCKTDDCDQLHCETCGHHTIGNTLIAGLCYDCFQAEEDEYNRRMNEEYQKNFLTV